MSIRLKYASGYTIVFQKHSSAPILFLEWLEYAQPKYKHPFDFKIKTIPCEDEILNDEFEIRFKAISKELITDCYTYIKSNL